MEIMLEMEDVDRLLRKALEAEGVTVPGTMRLIVRSNHKKGTLRVIYVEPLPSR